MSTSHNLIKRNVYSSRKYRIEIEEFDDDTAWVQIWSKHLYKHGIYSYRKTHRWRNWKMSWWFGYSHFLIDYAQDYGEYWDCLDRLQFSRCARRWFRNVIKPYLIKHGMTIY